MKVLNFFVYLLLSLSMLVITAGELGASKASGAQPPLPLASDQAQSSRRLHKKKVRERLVPGMVTEGELALQSDLMTTKEKKRKEKQERESQ